ncbi:MAG TPA: c-type cytochrome [Gemmatimonadales bacterium]|nr:c-type cytochrome [Gemmatimonadales bacterium]
MKRLLRWLRLALLGILALVILAGAVVYVLSERIVRRRYDEPLVAIAVPTDSLSVSEGQRLATLRGCSGGCHGSVSEGGVFIDEPLLARLVAPNLTASVRTYSDAELARIIRRGVRPDGRSVVGMPSEMFSPLTDADLGRIIAYLRSLPPQPGPGREVRLGPLARLGIVTGQYAPAAAWVRRADRLARSYPGPGDSTARGAYLARTACTECHGLDLRGGETTPDLRIVASYSLDAFTTLLRTGTPAGNRELTLMKQAALKRFSHFTDAEIGALYAFLRARAATPNSVK